MSGDPWSGDHLVLALATLANPHRLRVIAALSQGRRYVSELAREVGISRPLLQVHLRKLQSAGLVSAQLEVSDDGKAMNYYSLSEFDLHLTPERIAAVVGTISDRTSAAAPSSTTTPKDST